MFMLPFLQSCRLPGHHPSLVWKIRILADHHDSVVIYICSDTDILECCIQLDSKVSLLSIVTCFLISEGAVKVIVEFNPTCLTALTVQSAPEGVSVIDRIGKAIVTVIQPPFIVDVVCFLLCPKLSDSF